MDDLRLDCRGYLPEEEASWKKTLICETESRLVLRLGLVLFCSCGGLGWNGSGVCWVVRSNLNIASALDKTFTASSSRMRQSSKDSVNKIIDRENDPLKTLPTDFLNDDDDDCTNAGPIYLRHRRV